MNGLICVTRITYALSRFTRFSYDANGNLLSVTDAKNQTTAYTYDAMDRLTTRKDALNRQETYQYDRLGNLIQFKDRKNQTTTFVYDALNRRTGATYPDASATFGYDAINRLISVSDSVGGNITWVYDTVSGGHHPRVQETTTAGTMTVEYDEIGRRVKLSATGQSDTTYTYDAASQFKTVTKGTQTVTLNYDDAGRRTSLTYPNGVVTSYGYDNANRLLTIGHVKTPTTIEALTYTYDKGGNRITQLRQNAAASNLPTAVSAANIAYDAANEITRWNSATTNLTYDNNGNLSTETQGGVTTTYTWDFRNRLAGIGRTGLTASFVYDGLGRRKSKTINGTTTGFWFDGNDVYAELAGVTPSATYIRGLNIDEPYIRKGASDEFYETDALGSSLVLTDPAGASQTTYTYEPFGNTTQTGSASTNTFQFTGRENDGTGLSYYRARYYRAPMGRFLSEDPIGLRGGINQYSYVRNTPLSLVDPWGLADSSTPWQVGYEWFTGTGPRSHSFSAGDPFTEMLKQHSHVEDLRQKVTQACMPVPSPQQFNYSLAGVEGVVKYVQDYSTLATGGLTGNLAVTYLGSYQLDYIAQPLSGRKILVNFSVANTSSLASATRPPIIGYQDWWQQNVGSLLNGIRNSGPMSATRQTFNWSEVLRCQ